MWRTLKNATIFDGEDKDEENTDDEVKQGSGKVKRTTSWKNMMNQSDDDDATFPKPKACTIYEKPIRQLFVRSQQRLTHCSAASPTKACL